MDLKPNSMPTGRFTLILQRLGGWRGVSACWFETATAEDELVASFGGIFVAYFGGIHSLKLTANAPENRPKRNPKGISFLQPSIFRGYDVFFSRRVGWASLFPKKRQRSTRRFCWDQAAFASCYWRGEASQDVVSLCYGLVMTSLLLL